MIQPNHWSVDYVLSPHGQFPQGQFPLCSFHPRIACYVVSAHSSLRSYEPSLNRFVVNSIRRIASCVVSAYIPHVRGNCPWGMCPGGKATGGAARGWSVRSPSLTTQSLQCRPMLLCCIGTHLETISRLCSSKTFWIWWVPSRVVWNSCWSPRVLWASVTGQFARWQFAQRTIRP